MNYDNWIKRERRIRIKLLMDAPLYREKGRCLLCQDCGEICMCHEQTCPNCGSAKISGHRLVEAHVMAKERIRCRFRFERLLH